MDVDELVRHYPVLYHVAEAGSWPSIRENGLLSTSAVLDRFGIEGPDRQAIEERRRPSSVTLDHPVHGRVTIRDQKVLHDSKLAACLEDGLTPRDWYRILNRKVFFWLMPHRFAGLLDARAYRARRHTVITVDTARLIERHQEDLRLSHMNSGSTTPIAHPRGIGTFRTIEEYPFDERRRSRGLRDAIAELTVEYAVPDLAAFVLRVEEAGGDTPPVVLWETDRFARR